MDWLQASIGGLLLGGLYAAIAVGLSTMFGIVRVVNLAHGDFLVLAAYLALVLVSRWGIPPLLTLPLIAPLMYGAGYLLQRRLLNRTLGAAMEPPLLAAFGVAVIVQNALLLIFTPDAQSLATTLAVETLPLAGGVVLPVIHLIDGAVGLALVAALHFFFKYTYLGRAIRAAADDDVAARLVGVDTPRIYAHAMGVSMMSAAVAGVLVGMTFTFYPHSGSQYLIIAFGVAVIGGLGSMWGTLAGGVLLAEAQLLGACFTRPGYQLLIGYGVLLLVLGVRPQGMFGRPWGQNS